MTGTVYLINITFRMPTDVSDQHQLAVVCKTNMEVIEVEGRQSLMSRNHAQ